MRFFSSYKQAHEELNVPGSWQRGTIGTKETGITSIKLTANPKSFDRIANDLNTIYYVGRGKKSSPGEPAKNQEKDDQEAFVTSIRTGNPVFVFLKLKTGLVIYLGDYKVVSLRRVPGIQDIAYYQIKLVLVEHPN